MVTLAYLQRLALFALIWWAIAEGRVQSWIFGAPAVLVLSWFSLRWRAELWRIRPWPALCLFGYFLRNSIMGGIDVARRAIDPRLPLHPGMIDYRTRVVQPGARLLLTNMLSLLPGTMSTELHGGVIRIHVLDTRLAVTRAIAALEQRVAATLDVPLTGATDEEHR